jgi:hypothetical protein
MSVDKKRQRHRRNIARGLGDTYERAPTRDVSLDALRVFIVSDHHKGARDGADDFQRCERAYVAALGWYLEQDFRLAVLGDAEELWECSPSDVIGAYPDVFELEAEFHRLARYDRFWGNHDDDWRVPSRVDRLLGEHFPELEVLESLRLRVQSDGASLGVLFLAHGHQGTLESDRFGFVSRLVVRHVWRPLQRRLGMASTSPARDWELRADHEGAMFDWARSHPDRPVLIAGHTHRPVFETQKPPSPEPPELHWQKSAPTAERARRRAVAEWAQAERRRVGRRPAVDVAPPCFFNTGCASFGDGDITGLEIADGLIRLVRWPNENGEPLPKELARADLRDVLARVAGGERPSGTEELSRAAAPGG